MKLMFVVPSTALTVIRLSNLKLAIVQVMNFYMSLNIRFAV